MGYFPFYMDIKGAKAVIAGGGEVAARKIEKLLPFGPDLTVIAPEFSSRMETLSHGQDGGRLSFLKRTVRQEDLCDAAFVIAATDDEAVNAAVSEFCRARRIPVNVVDDREKCTFIFPALVTQGDLTVGISTDGKCPAAAAFIRGEIEQSLPEGIGNTIALLGELRAEVMDGISDQAQRAKVMEQLFLYSMRREGEVSLLELRSLLHGMER